MAEMWYYTTEGKQMDPVTMKELKRLVGDGTLKPTDMVWKDGMARWIRASSVKELFPDPMAELDKYFTNTREAGKKEAAATGVQAPAGTTSTASASSNGSVPTTADSGQQKKRPKSDTDDGDDRGPPKRRTEAAKAGGSMVLVIVSLLAVGVLMVALCGGVVILIVAWPGGSAKGTPINGETSYNVTTVPGGQDQRSFTFRKDVEYEITVKSQPNFQGIDIDLFVFHRNGNLEASDVAIGPDCKLRFTPREEAEYRVEVRNVAGNQNVISTVTIREVKDALPKNDGPPKDQVNKDAPPRELPLPKDVREGNGFVDVDPLGTKKFRTYKFRVKAGHPVSFRMTALDPGPNTVFHLVVVKENDANTILAQDRPLAPNASVTFRPQETQIVHVRVMNAGKQLGRGQLFYDVSPP